jgi:CRP-like cAMP-binding protein
VSFVSHGAEPLIDWLPSIALFGGLQAPTLRRVISRLVEHRIEPGVDICRQDEAGRAMFLIRTGEVLVCRDLESGRRLKMLRLGPGEFFGEMTLIDVQRRSATVTVEQPAVLYSLSNRDLYQLYQEDVPGYVMILQNLCRELSRRLRVTNRRLQSLAEDSPAEEATLIHPALRAPTPI